MSGLWLWRALCVLKSHPEDPVQNRFAIRRKSRFPQGHGLHLCSLSHSRSLVSSLSLAQMVTGEPYDFDVCEGSLSACVVFVAVVVT